MSFVERVGLPGIEDLTRYEFASRYVSGRTVLDAACGSGYGSEMLRRDGCAKAVIGVDVSDDGLRAAKANTPLLMFGNLACLPLRDACIDVVVSMETIEHLQTPEMFVREVRRVLKPHGIAIFSTPQNNGDSRSKPDNPYHIREYSPVEFGALVGAEFRHVERWSQVTSFKDDLFPKQTCGDEPGHGSRRILRIVVPKAVRAYARRAIGSKGLRADTSEVVEGIVERAGVQIAVCR